MARVLCALLAVVAYATVVRGAKLADVGRLTLLGSPVTLADPNPGAASMELEADWGLAFNVLKHLNPDSPHLSGVDATNAEAVRVRPVLLVCAVHLCALAVTPTSHLLACARLRQAAVAKEEQRLYDTGTPSVEAVTDALFQAKPHLYFMQVGVHAGALLASLSGQAGTG